MPRNAAGACDPHSNPLVALRGDVAFGTFSLLPPPAHSQEWPARPLTMVVPTAAGGGADIVGRILAARLAELLGQPVIIENVGNAVAANNRVAKGGPDGYQFVLGFTAHHAFHPTLHKTPVYNPPPISRQWLWWSSSLSCW